MNVDSTPPQRWCLFKNTTFFPWITFGDPFERLCRACLLFTCKARCVDLYSIFFERLNLPRLPVAYSPKKDDQTLKKEPQNMRDFRTQSNCLGKERRWMIHLTWSSKRTKEKRRRRKMYSIQQWRWVWLIPEERPWHLGSCTSTVMDSWYF